MQALNRLNNSALGDKVSCKMDQTPVEVIKDDDGKFDDYSNQPKTRQILLHCGNELTEKDFFIDFTNQ